MDKYCVKSNPQELFCLEENFPPALSFLASNLEIDFKERKEQYHATLHAYALEACL